MNQVELQRVMWVMGRGTLVHSLGSMNLSPMILCHGVTTPYVTIAKIPLIPI